LDNYIDTVGVAPAERDCIYVTGDPGSYSEDIIIKNNILKNPSRNGIGLSTALRNVVVSGNHIGNCATWGIGGESATGGVFVEDVVVSNNTIDTANRPLVIADDCLRWVVTDNIVTGGTFDGIIVERADPGTVISGNIVHGNERDGILVNETTDVIVSNNIVFDNSNETHNTWSGIAFTDVQNGSISGNVVTDTGGSPLQQYGVTLDASTTDINGEGNVAVGNQTGGFVDSGSNNFVQMVTTLTQVQWGYLAALDQSLATSDDPVFAGLFIRDPSSLGAEIHTDANAASDPNSNEADATTGWSDIQVTLTSDSGDPQTGTYALKGVADDGDTDRIEYDFTAVVGATYKVSIWAKRGAQGTSQFFQNWTNIAIPQTSISSATWTEYTFFVVATGTAAKIRAYAAGAGAAGDEVFVDNVSIKQVTGGILSVADDFNVGGVSYQNGIVNTGTVLAGRETEGAPTYSFYDDSNTGMFNIASDILAFSTSGSEAMRIDASQNLVIGPGAAHDGFVTTAPAEVQTADATVTTLDSITLLDDNVYKVTGHVLAIQADGTSAVYEIKTGVKRTSGGAATLFGSIVSVITSEDEGSWDCTFTVNGNDIRLSVTGEAATTIDWGGHLEYENMSN